MKYKKSIWALILIGMISQPAFAEKDSNNTEILGDLRFGFIDAEDDAGESIKGSAIGGKLGYVSPQWNGLRAGATFYTTQEISDDENGDFFSSQGESYSILGEVYAQAEFYKTIINAGRFELDSHYADTDDLRMIPNTFQGLLLSNTDIFGTTVYLTHLDKWAGVGTDIPEDFTDMSGDDGVNAVGVVFEGVENLALQAWYYDASDTAKLSYLDAVYETDLFSVGAQYGDQSDQTQDGSGPDGDVAGVTGSLSFSGFTASAAYNEVSGTVINGFGGGPFFTSSDDHTIDGVEDQEATAFGLEYAGIEGLSLAVWTVDFDKGEDETDYVASWDIREDLNAEFIYTDMNADGNFARLMVNYLF
jgi:hypothetical protein